MIIDHLHHHNIIVTTSFYTSPPNRCPCHRKLVCRSTTVLLYPESHISISCPINSCQHNHLWFQGTRPHSNRLIDIYCKSNNIVCARYLFDKIPKPDIKYISDESPLSIRDTVSYNAMITGFSHSNDGYNAVKLFNEMRKYGFRPDNLTFASSAAALVAHDEKECKQLHCNVVKTGADVFVSIESARELFDGMNEKLQVAYNAMISGYFQHGFMLKVLEIFKSMHLEGIELDEFTYTSVISGCANSGLFLIGKQVHGSILRTGWKPASELALPVNNALVILYCKCGKVDQARQIIDSMLEKDHVSVGRIGGAKSVFSAMPERGLLTWMVMFSGLAQNGYGEDALKLFDRMRTEGLAPCDYSFAGAITACASLGALEHGRQLHAQLIQLGFNSSLSAGNALIS
ncbi:hypothetical protein MKX01_036991, partial [Papaver californicum]